MSYFHDTEVIINNHIFKEKGRLYKNISKDGTFNYSYEVRYFIDEEKLPGFPIGEFLIDAGLIFSDPAWAHASQEDIDKAIIRKIK